MTPLALVLLGTVIATPIFSVKQTVPLAASSYALNWVDARHAIVVTNPPEGNVDGLAVTLSWTLFDTETGALSPLRLRFADWARSHGSVLLAPRDQQHFVPVDLLDVDVAHKRAFLLLRSYGVDRIRALFALWDLSERTITWTVPLADDVERREIGVPAADETEVLGVDAHKRRVLVARQWRSTPADPACRDPQLWKQGRSSPKLAARCGVDRVTIVEIDIDARQRRELYTLPLRLTVGGPTLFVDPDGTRVFVVEWTDGHEPVDGTVIDLATRRTLVQRARLPGSTSGVVWTRDALFFGVSQRKSIARVDLRTGAVVRFANWPRLNFVITPGPDGRSILALSDDYRVGVFDVAAKPPATARERPGLDGVRLFEGTRFSPDHRHALTQTSAPLGEEPKLLLLDVAP